MSNEPTPEKKLIIDEDWKSQVEAEKEAAKHVDEPAKGAEPPHADAHATMPPAELGFLIGTLYIQGAMALGLLPNPMTKKVETHFEQAKHSIDLLAMLQQKTEGNRTQQESDELEATLHELRMAFVTVQQK